jgi:hypothetical protein
MQPSVRNRSPKHPHDSIAMIIAGTIFVHVSQSRRDARPMSLFTALFVSKRCIEILQCENRSACNVVQTRTPFRFEIDVDRP